LYEFPSTNERSLLFRGDNVDKKLYKQAANNLYSFLYIDKPEFVAKKFKEIVISNLTQLCMSCSNGLLGWSGEVASYNKIVVKGEKGGQGVGF